MPAVILTTRQLSARLDVSTETIVHWIERGLISPLPTGRRWRSFDLDDVIERLRPRVPIHRWVHPAAHRAARIAACREAYRAAGRHRTDEPGSHPCHS